MAPKGIFVSSGYNFVPNLELMCTHTHAVTQTHTAHLSNNLSLCLSLSRTPTIKQTVKCSLLKFDRKHMVILPQ